VALRTCLLVASSPPEYRLGYTTTGNYNLQLVESVTNRLGIASTVTGSSVGNSAKIKVFDVDDIED